MFPAFQDFDGTFDYDDSPVLALNLFALLLLLAALGRTLLCGACTSALAAIRSVARTVLSVLRGSVEAPPELQRLVDEKRRGQCVRDVARLHWIVSMLSLAATLFHLGRQASGDPFVPVASSPPQRVGRPLLICFYGATTLLPRLLTVRTVDIICGMPLLMAGLLALPPFCPLDARYDTMVRGMALVLPTILVRRTVRTRARAVFFGCYIFWVLCLLLTTAQMIRSHFHSSPGPKLGLTVSSLLYPMGYILFSVFIFLIGVALDGGVERLLLCELRAERDGQALEAATALLRSCCDVVAELDGHGRFAAKARDLSSFLLRDGLTLQGTLLTDLVADEEGREELGRRFAIERPEGAQTAESMHISMRDGNNSMLRLEIIWIKFQCPGGLAVLAGLREFADPHPTQRGVAAIREPVPTSCPLVADASCLPEGSTVSSESSLGAHACVKLVLDSTQKGLPVRAVTSAFAVQIGRLPRGALLDDHMKHPTAFKAWLGSALAAARDQKRAPDDKDVVLQLPRGRVRASVCLEADAPDLGTADADLKQKRTEQVQDPTRIGILFLEIRKDDSSRRRWNGGRAASPARAPAMAACSL